MTNPAHADQPLLPEARHALVEAVRTARVVDATEPSRRRRRPSRRIGLSVVAAVVVSGTAVAATTPWNPQLGSDRGGHPSRSVAGIPADQLTMLQVLRRPATDADRSARVRGALRFVDGWTFGGVHVDGIRLLRAGDGRERGDVVLVPAKRSGPKDLPRAVQTRDALCVVQTFPRGISAAGSFCGTASDVRRGRLRNVLSGVVPDGVAEVRVRLRTGRTLVAPVRDNYYALPFRDPVVERLGDDAAQAAALRAFRKVNGRPIVWLDAHGAPVRKGPVPKGR